MIPYALSINGQVVANGYAPEPLPRWHIESINCKCKCGSRLVLPSMEWAGASGETLWQWLDAHGDSNHETDCQVVLRDGRGNAFKTMQHLFRADPQRFR